MADVDACVKAAVGRSRPHRADKAEAPLINMGRPGDPARRRPIARHCRYSRVADREDAMPVGQASQGAQHAKEGTRFDLARHKVPPHPVKRRPVAPRRHKINVAVVSLPVDDPRAGRCLEPSATAIKNPTGFRIEGFETRIIPKASL